MDDSQKQRGVIIRASMQAVKSSTFSAHPPSTHMHTHTRTHTHAARGRGVSLLCSELISDLRLFALSEKSNPLMLNCSRRR